MNPKKEKYHESVQVKMALPFTLMKNKSLCAACYFCHNPWIVKMLKLGYFMLRDREIKSDQTM